MVGAAWARWRRHREAAKAISSLVQAEDRMLRDMGIGHRGQIERAVKYGRE